MSAKTSIEWTRGDDGSPGATWNPVRGCTKVSPGCKHCYVETFAERWRGIAGHPYERGFDPRLVPEQLDAPLRWRRPRKIFVNSMSDLFGEFVLNEYIAAVFGVMASAQQHTYQVLTKRAERLPTWFEWLGEHGHQRCIVELLKHDIPYDSPRGRRDRLENMGAGWPWPLACVHLGVSVEDRKYGVPRIEHLRRTPAAVRFLSIEPLLEDVGELDLSGIHQVIVGAESGHGARPMRDDWVRSIRDQAVAQGVAFFYKQQLDDRGRKVSLPVLDGRSWSEAPKP